jgi:hypothetical protein
MFKDTHLFSPAANYFLKHNFYCEHLEGTKAYFDFWDEEKRRCLQGYEVDGVKITGYHYFYLNYCPIDRAVDQEMDDGTVIAVRERTFPAFYDGDYEFFHAMDDCRKSNSHLTVLKARRKGYSYKAGSMMARNYSIYETLKTLYLLQTSSI